MANESPNKPLQPPITGGSTLRTGKIREAPGVLASQNSTIKLLPALFLLGLFILTGDGWSVNAKTHDEPRIESAIGQ